MRRGRGGIQGVVSGGRVVDLQLEKLKRQINGEAERQFDALLRDQAPVSAPGTVSTGSGLSGFARLYGPFRS